MWTNIVEPNRPRMTIE